MFKAIFNWTESRFRFIVNPQSMEYEVEGPRPKKTWREVVKEDCQAHKQNTEDAMDHSKWRKLIKHVR